MMLEELTTDRDVASKLRPLWTDGFAFIDDFLDRDEIDALIEHVAGMAFDAQSSRMKRDAMFARRNLLRLDFVREAIASPKVQSIIDAVAHNMIAVRAILFDKTGAANWTVPWHQDRSIAVRDRIETSGFGPWSIKAGIHHVQPPVEILRQMVTLRIHLDVCGEENGPLRVIPATHQHNCDAAAIDHLVASTQQVNCSMNAGGLLVMRPLLLHASSPAKKASHRRVLHIEFGPRELPGGLKWALA